MRICVILNPAAGRGSAVEQVRDAVDSLPEVELRVSPEPEAVRVLARSAVSEGFRRIVAAGGDGTVSAVATELRARASDSLRLECGVIPVGTGNDLAFALGIPTEVEAAVELLRTGRARPVDAIRCGRSDTGPVRFAGSFAWNAIVGGFGGGVSDHLTPARKRRWRRLAYYRAAVSELRRLAPHQLRLVMDGHPVELELLMLVIANGDRTGGGIRLAPGALPDDGALDVVGFRPGPALRTAALAARVMAGRHFADPAVFHARCRELSVEADSSFRYNRDGEDWGGGDARFALDTGALPFVRP